MTKKADTVRLNLSLSRQQKAYLDALAEFGLHGQNASEVARHLVVRELERLCEQGFLKRVEPRGAKHGE